MMKRTCFMTVIDGGLCLESPCYK